MCVLGVKEDGTVQDPGQEVMGATLVAVDRRKIAGDGGVGPVLSSGFIQGDRDGNFEGLELVGSLGS